MIGKWQEWAATHLVLWPALAVVLILYLMAYWVRHHRDDTHSTTLVLLLTLSYLMGLVIVGVSLFRDEDLPRWFHKGTVLSALAIGSILISWLMFFVANKWVGHALTDGDRRRRDSDKPRS